MREIVSLLLGAARIGTRADIGLLDDATRIDAD
jgi:hypothetical protein